MSQSESFYATQIEGILFHLNTLVPMAELMGSEQFAHVDEDMLAMMLDQAARFSREHLAPLAASGDREGCSLRGGQVWLPMGMVEAYRQWCELGFPALGLPLEEGGLAFPKVMQAAVQEVCDGANMAFGMMAINQRCAAATLLENASPELCKRWLPELVSGESAATIVISEPQAGSDVGRISTAATISESGTWRINGCKIWISFGDHNATEQILHMVLARVPNGQPGTRGLGLFLVPKLLDNGFGERKPNGVSPGRLEHKMGLHGSPTCEIQFDNAVGYLIGEQGRGIQNLFAMMNAMRLAVAVQGAAVANAATGIAIDYAGERPQGGPGDQPAKMIIEHQDVKRMLLEMMATSELVRAMTLRTALSIDLASTAKDDNTRDWYSRLAALLLPVAKTVAAESGFQVASQGIQVLGGYGYTSDYPLERLARDIRVSSIYEGTSGIQALDFLLRKVISDKGASLLKILGEIETALTSAQSPFSSTVESCLTPLRDVLESLLSEDKKAIEASAYPFLNLTGLAVHCWHGHLLYCAATSSSAYHLLLRDALSYFCSSVEGRATELVGRIKHGELTANFN